MVFDELVPEGVKASPAPWEGGMPPGVPQKEAVAKVSHAVLTLKLALRATGGVCAPLC